MDRVVQKRFWKRITKPRGECWAWQGHRNAGGYGRLKINKRLWLAHRVAYTLAKGPIPGGMVVMHTCDTPACCNPTHLRVGTVAENVADCGRKGRRPRRMQRLTIQERHAIKARYAAGGVTQKTLAEQFGCSRQLVNDIVNGRLKSTQS